MSDDLNPTIEESTFDPVAEKAAVDSAEGRGEGRTRPRRRRKVSYLTLNKIESVDYKEVNILRRFLTERGKILPSRQSGNTAKQQRMITQAVKRAREMALLPFVARDLVDDSYSRRPRPDRPGRMRDREQAPAQETTE